MIRTVPSRRVKNVFTVPCCRETFEAIVRYRPVQSFTPVVTSLPTPSIVCVLMFAFKSRRDLCFFLAKRVEALPCLVPSRLDHFPL